MARDLSSGLFLVLSLATLPACDDSASRSAIDLSFPDLAATTQLDDFAVPRDLVIASVDLTSDLAGLDLSGLDFTSAAVDATTTGDSAVVAGDLTTTGTVDMVTCATTTCGTAVCGASYCGFHCGTCSQNKGCASGACVNLGSCPGTVPCVDAFGGSVCQGGAGLRVCPTDSAKRQLCVCGGGGATDWSMCSPTCM